MKPFEQGIVLGYLANAVRAGRTHPAIAHAVCDWAAEHGAALGLAGLPDADEADLHSARRRRRAQTPPLAPLAAAVARRAQVLARVAPGKLEKRLQELAALTGLTPLDQAVLGLMLRYALSPPVEALWDAVCAAQSRMPRLTLRHGILRMLLGEREAAIAGRLAPQAPLLASGLLAVDRAGDVTVLDRVVGLVDAPAIGKDMKARLLGQPATPSLAWADFDHIAADRDHIARLVGGALEQRRAGINILLYGPAGTGKTEFCKTVAARLGLPLFAVAETDDDGGEPARGERLSELRLSQRLLSGGDGALLLFDEMGDLVDGGGGAFGRLFGHPAGGGSKVYLHRLLEATPVPTFWTTNAVADLDAAVLRRMTYAAELRVPSLPVRARVWRRELARHGLTLGDRQITDLARDFPAPPAVAAAAVASVGLFNGDVDDLRRSVASIAKAMAGGTAPAPQVAAGRFDPALVNADEDVLRLAERLTTAGGSRAFSLCLSGPPGTGKSAYARWLAERLGLEVVVRRASDLLGPYVGESEHNIAAAFAEARAASALLIFDEADSLLSDRRGARQSWEVSQVNEMLTWMECHPLPFVCTTNLAERLDQAALRRFLFKLRFDCLRPDQAQAAFRRFSSWRRRLAWPR